MTRRSASKQNRKSQRTAADRNDHLSFSFADQSAPPTRAAKIIKPQSKAQATYLKLMDANELVFGLGPAGTGKTYLASAKAGDWFVNGDVEKIYVTRPAVEAGENLGFLPGELEEKIAPYFVPVIEALNDKLGAGRVKYMLASKQLEFVPIAFMRGRSLHNAAVIVDEAQNTTPTQMKMILTRAGQGTRYIVNGDLNQSDIEGPNGLRDAVLKFQGKPSVGVMKFGVDDVVRSRLAAMAVHAYEGEDKEQDEALYGLPPFITGEAANDRHDALGQLPRQSGD